MKDATTYEKWEYNCYWSHEDGFLVEWFEHAETGECIDPVDKARFAELYKIKGITA